MATSKQSSEGRYFLVGVPAGLDDERLKCTLGELIKCPEGILEVRWRKPAISEQIGGTVELRLDEKAVQLLQKMEEVTIDGKTAVFVDRDDMPIQASANIDDDIVQLAKSMLPSGQSWESVVGKLKMTKLRNEEEDYDYWLVEGPFSEMKRFNATLHAIILSRNWPANPSENEGKSPDDAEHEDPIRSPVKSDDSFDFNEVPEFLKIENEAEFHPQTFRLEFVVGDITKERHVDAIVNPSNFKLEATANDLSRAISAAMGGQNYEAVCKEVLDEQCGSISATFAVLTGAGCLAIKYVMHVVVPELLSATESTAMREIGACYSHCFDLARRAKVQSIAFPPIGLESGVETRLALGGAISALVEASSNQVPRLGEYMKKIRFVLPDEEVLHEFENSFHALFEVVVRRQNQSDDEEDGAKSSKAEEVCRCCDKKLRNGMPMKKMPKCGHKLHKECLEQVTREKRDCPECAHDVDIRLAKELSLL